MLKTKHCELCDHQETSLKEGTTCGLTTGKPDFDTTCSNIKLKDKFTDKLKVANIEFEKIRRTKIVTYIYFVVYLFLGLAVIAGAYLLFTYVLNKGVVVTTVPIVIMGAGLTLSGMGVGTLIKFTQNIKYANRKKASIDGVLNLYKIDYDIEMKFGREYHGSQEVDANVKFRKIR